MLKEALKILCGLSVLILIFADFVCAERLPVKIYTSDDGIGSNAIFRLVRDSRGFIWLCSRDGLVRFDGYRFITYRIGNEAADPAVFDLIPTRNGAYWINLNRGTAYDLGTALAGSIAGTNYLATAEPNEPAHARNTLGGKSVWYRFQTPTRRAVTFETHSDFEGEIAVYVSSVANPTFAQLIKLDDNSDTSAYTYKNPAVNFAAIPNQYYFIAVDYNDYDPNFGDSGSFQLKFFQTKLRYSMRTYDNAPITGSNVFRPSEGRWYNLGSFTSNVGEETNFGLPTDKPVPADFDGDGKADLAVFRRRAIGIYRSVRQTRRNLFTGARRAISRFLRWRDFHCPNRTNKK